MRICLSVIRTSSKYRNMAQSALQIMSTQFDYSSLLLPVIIGEIECRLWELKARHFLINIACLRKDIKTLQTLHDYSS